MHRKFLAVHRYLSATHLHIGDKGPPHSILLWWFGHVVQPLTSIYIPEHCAGLAACSPVCRVADSLALRSPNVPTRFLQKGCRWLCFVCVCLVRAADRQSKVGLPLTLQACPHGLCTNSAGLTPRTYLPAQLHGKVHASPALPLAWHTSESNVTKLGHICSLSKAYCWLNYVYPQTNSLGLTLRTYLPALHHGTLHASSALPLAWHTSVVNVSYKTGSCMFTIKDSLLIA